MTTQDKNTQGPVRLPTTGSFSKAVIAEREGLKVVRLTVPSGVEVPEHHANVDVVVTVVRGRGTFTVEGTARAVAPGDVIEMPPRARHSLRAEGETLELIVVHARITAPAGSAPVNCGS